MADPTPPTLRPSKHSRIMDNFKNSVFNLANSYSITPLSPSQIAFIDQQLLLAFPDFQTPTHPTYTAMIETAVKELNEKYGSDEESISDFIKKNYVSLPWAHSAYLSHHLRRMCKNGEIVCTSSKLYTTPALIEEHNLRIEQPKQSLWRRIRDCVVEEGNLGGGKVVKVSGDVVEFQEEDMMVFGRSRMKRRRRSCVVFEEDEEVGGGDIVQEEHDDFNFSQNLVVNEVGALEDGDDMAWRSRVMGRRLRSAAVEEYDEVEGSAVVGRGQNNISTSKNLVIGRRNEEVMRNDVIDLTGEASETSEEWNGIATVSEDHDLVNVPVEQLVVDGLKSELQPIECQSEVIPLDDDECKRKTEPKLLVPSSMGALHAKHGSEVTTKTMTMNDDKSAAELVVEPVECAEKSSVKDLVLKESELLIRVGVDELAVTTSALKESELMIVPFVDNNPTAAISAGINPTSEKIDPVIICGLPVPVPELKQPKRKQLVYYPRKRSKASTKKRKVSSKSSPALPVDRNLFDHCQQHEHSSHRDSETKPCETLLESPNFKGLPAGQSQQACTLSWFDGSIGQLDRQKSLDPWHHHSRWDEFISVDDEENLPLQQVLEKCGKRRKHVAQSLTEDTTPLMTEASSISCLKLPGRKEKQPQQQRRQRKLKPQDQKYSSFKADTVAATESITSPSLHIGEWRKFQRCVDSVEEISDVLHHHQHQGQDKDQGSSLQFELTAETFPSNEGQIWKDKQQTRADNTLPWEPEQSAKVNAVELPPTQNLNGQKDELDIGEMVSNDVMEDKVSTLGQSCQQLINQQESEEETSTSFLLQHQCLWQQEVPSESVFNLVVEEPSRSATNLIVEEKPSNLCQIDKVSTFELATDQLNVCPEVQPSEFLATEPVVSDILPSEQEKHPITKSPLLEPSFQNPKNQIDDQEGKSQIDGRLQAVEATLATLVEEIVPIGGEETLTKTPETISRSNWWRSNSDEDQKCEQTKLVEKKLRRRPQKQLEESEDVVPSLDEQLQQQNRVSKPATHQNQKQKNEKKRGRGRPRKEERETKVKDVLLILQPQIKKLGRPRKQKEETEGSAVAISNMHLQQQGLSETEIDQNSQLQIMQPNTDGPESLLKQVEASKEDELVSSNLDIQIQEVSSESALIPNILPKIKLPKQPWIQTDGEDAVVSSNLHLQLQEGSYEPYAGHHSQQCTKQMKEESLERPWKELEAANKDEVVALNLHAYQQEGSFESESGQQFQQGMSPKQREVSEEDTAVSSKLHFQKQAMYSAPATLGISQQQVSEILQSEVHRISEAGQATPPSDNETCQQLKKHKVHVGGQRPKTRAMTASSDNQPDQQQKEWRCHEQEGSQGKFEGQRPKTRAMTISSNSQPDQQQMMQCSHEHEGSRGKFEVVQCRKTRAMTTSENQPVQQQNEWHWHEHEGNLGKFEADQDPKMRATTTSSDNQPDQQLNERSCQKSANITVVPLASKDQLRSRVKR